MKNCKHSKKYIFKMGGLLCPKCRKIIHEAYTKEWRKKLEELREKK